MSKKTYRVRPGVGWVNGACVPETGKLALTDAEARFDLDHGRIELAGGKSKTIERGGAETDGGN